MSVRTVDYNELPSLVGQETGVSDWVQVDQERVNQFAEATGDHQWIHVDTERAAAGPFGGTIAHGYLTLSLVIPFFAELLQVRGVSMGVNSGLDLVRFPAPARGGCRCRLAARIDRVTPVGGGGAQVFPEFTVEIEGSAKPACVAHPIYRYYP